MDKDKGWFKSLVSEWVKEPTTMPRGSRSILLRDPDGNLCTPITEEAINKFSGR